MNNDTKSLITKLKKYNHRLASGSGNKNIYMQKINQYSRELMTMGIDINNLQRAGAAPIYVAQEDMLTQQLLEESSRDKNSVNIPVSSYKDKISENADRVKMVAEKANNSIQMMNKMILESDKLVQKIQSDVQDIRNLSHETELDVASQINKLDALNTFQVNSLTESNKELDDIDKKINKSLAISYISELAILPSSQLDNYYQQIKSIGNDVIEIINEEILKYDKSIQTKWNEFKK